MIDAEESVKQYLLSGVAATLALAALVDDRIYIDLALPVGYTIQSGDALVFKTRAGSQAYHSHSFNPSMQFLSYSATRDGAAAIDQALYGALNDRQTEYFKMARLQTPGQLLRQPGGLFYYLSFYRVWVGNP